MLMNRFEQWIPLSEVMRLDSWTANNVLFRPNARRKVEDGYWPVPRFDPDDPPVEFPSNFAKLYYMIWRKRGMADADIAAKLRREEPQACRTVGVLPGEE